MDKVCAVSLCCCASLLVLSGCEGEKQHVDGTAAGYSSAAELPGFCDRLPRSAWSEFEKHPSSNDWFEVYEIEPGIFSIYEPWQWQEVISWLIVGDEGALLFDTGNGIGDIGAVVRALTDLPVSVVNSHSHFDHIGGNHQFERILSVSTSFSLEKAAGYQTDELLAEVSPGALCKQLPGSLRAEDHRVRPYSIGAKIDDGDNIDLGGRRLEVLLIPGHTPDAIALLDREAGFLWSGDSFYEGPIWLFAPETDLPAYRQSVARLAELAGTLTAVFPAHNTPRADPQLLSDLRDKLDLVLAGDIEPVAVGDGAVEFRFEGFSLLMRSDYYQLEFDEPQ